MALVAKSYFNQHRSPGSTTSTSTSTSRSRSGLNHQHTLNPTTLSKRTGHSNSRSHSSNSTTKIRTCQTHQPQQIDAVFADLPPRDWFSRSQDERRRLRPTMGYAYSPSPQLPEAETSDAGDVYNYSPPLTPGDSVSQISSSSGSSERSRRSRRSVKEGGGRFFGGRGMVDFWGFGGRGGEEDFVGGYGEGYGEDERAEWNELSGRFERVVRPDWVRGVKRG